MNHAFPEDRTAELDGVPAHRSVARDRRARSTSRSSPSPPSRCPRSSPTAASTACRGSSCSPPATPRAAPRAASASANWSGRPARTACASSARTPSASSTPPPSVRLNASLAPELPAPRAASACSPSPARSASPCCPGCTGAAAHRVRRPPSSPPATAPTSPATTSCSTGTTTRTPTSSCMYLESIGNPRKFTRLARRTAAVEAGRGRQGRPAQRQRARRARRAGHPASRDATVSALLRQAGVIRVDTVTELVDAGLLLARQPLPARRRASPILGNSESLGLLTYDACLTEGLRPLPPLRPDHGGRRPRTSARRWPRRWPTTRATPSSSPPSRAVGETLRRRRGPGRGAARGRGGGPGEAGARGPRGARRPRGGAVRRGEHRAAGPRDGARRGRAGRPPPALGPAAPPTARRPAPPTRRAHPRLPRRRARRPRARRGRRSTPSGGADAAEPGRVPEYEDIDEAGRRRADRRRCLARRPTTRAAVTLGTGRRRRDAARPLRHRRAPRPARARPRRRRRGRRAASATPSPSRPPPRTCATAPTSAAYGSTSPTRTQLRRAYAELTDAPRRRPRSCGPVVQAMAPRGVDTVVRAVDRPGGRRRALLRARRRRLRAARRHRAPARPGHRPGRGRADPVHPDRTAPLRLARLRRRSTPRPSKSCCCGCRGWSTTIPRWSPSTLEPVVVAPRGLSVLGASVRLAPPPARDRPRPAARLPQPTEPRPSTRCARSQWAP